MNDTVDTLLEVKLGEEDDFLKVRETLSRIGVASRKRSLRSPKITFRFLKRKIKQRLSYQASAIQKL